MGKKNDLFPKNLTLYEFNTLKEVTLDPFSFANKSYITHPIKGKIRFELFPYQKAVLWNFIVHRFVQILKFRQAGITELLALYSLWLAMYRSSRNIQIISIKDRVAKRFLRRVKFIYKNLDHYLQVPIINGRPGDFGTATEIEFSNGSTITSIPTTEDAGRSEAVSLLILDEAAIIRWASQIWTAAFPTLSTGGAAIVNSTPYGVGNWYHKLWVDALSGGNQFVPLRLFWDMHPERDQNWYDIMKEALGPRRTAQEIDGDFLSSGDTVFDLVDIKAIEDRYSELTNVKKLMNGNLLVFQDPKPGEKYFLGADIATGRSRDYSAFSIMNRHGEEMACFKGKIPPNRFKNLIGDYGLKYNFAKLAPEAVGIGEGPVSALQEEGYPNLYYSVQLLREKGKNKPKSRKVPGWYTTTANRSVIIDGLETDIRNDTCDIKDPFFCQEAYTFIYDHSNKPIALGKDSKGEDSLDDETYADDSILAKAITNHIRKGKINSVVVTPK